MTRSRPLYSRPGLTIFEIIFAVVVLWVLCTLSLLLHTKFGYPLLAAVLYIVAGAVTLFAVLGSVLNHFSKPDANDDQDKPADE